MITTKEEYKYYLECDKRARFGNKDVGWLDKYKKGSLWKYNVCLRRLEYCMGRKNFASIILKVFYRAKLNKLSEKTGWSVPPNVAGPGLLIVHRETVVVSPKASIGSNCRIHACVNIGAWKDEAPTIGDNVYIGPGVKMFGGISIASNIAIGANAVVNQDFDEEGISIGGIPAKKISDKGSPYTELGVYS